MIKAMVFLQEDRIEILGAMAEKSESGHQGDGVRGQALVGALCSAVTAWLAVRFLMRFFETRTLTPFAVYCFAAGLACSLWFLLT